ncbi:type III polyketide synthase [Sphingomonas rhizophila]|uniref:Type III polyketide synthase n=1 Tax=Sphingomonas rhizophila TaxID=2071607 RepID=A0A7G9SC55_9SPHN|nr:3-oxoacyl-[acyl-carrier-protein] synthase III C-terminal domain-containing protein [Sphingomonas rhizophila]QNN65430.1 type III polyketide synthase [Sphingomonas rhizophila]
MQSTRLLSVATAVPPTIISQADAKRLGRELFGGRKLLFDRLAGVFDNAGIDQRHIVAPVDWYREQHGWGERNRVFLDAADTLFIDAATKAISGAGLQPTDIDGIVTVSTTGIATPSLEARNGPAIGLRPDVRRVPVFGLGCAGGVSGLATAARLAAAEPGTRWLFVTIETCSISIRLDSDDPAAIVATALFGDGAAAAIVSTAGDGIATIAGAGEKLWPDTLGIMGWRVEDPGLGVVFDRAIPPFIEAELAVAVDGILAANGRTRTDIYRFCCHPGGIKVIDAIETALTLEPQALDVERAVLRDFGNMSAPTVLFVLENLIARGLPGRTMMTAFGPGFTCAGLLLDR